MAYHWSHLWIGLTYLERGSNEKGWDGCLKVQVFVRLISPSLLLILKHEKKGEIFGLLFCDNALAPHTVNSCL